ncbi:MAG: signal peptide peptidase SppA [Devosiaceae bacterium]|nr:signal peptide peptidase SppA [Devosiaceae bacterium MH13]
MTIEALTPDALVERRRLRRSRTLWRVLAILFAVGLIFGLLATFTPLADRLQQRTDHVARISLEGFIDFDEPFLELLDTLKDDDQVEAVILRVNSPGGLAVAGEALFTGLRDLGDEKPLVAVVDGVGTSAAYLAAIASERIIARHSSIVGSIGVLVQVPDASELLDTLGIAVNDVRSGELKAQPSIFTEPSEDAIAALDELVQDNFTWFVDQVADRRGLDGAVIRGFEGRVFTGSRGVEAGLIDGLGGEDEAMAYLAETHEIDADMQVLDRAPARPVNLPGAAARGLAHIGFGGGEAGITLSGEGIRDALRDAMLLDGILSVWHGR